MIRYVNGQLSSPGFAVPKGLGYLAYVDHRCVLHVTHDIRHEVFVNLVVEMSNPNKYLSLL